MKDKKHSEGGFRADASTPVRGGARSIDADGIAAPDVIGDGVLPLPAWKAETKALVALGLPFGLTQLVQFSVNTIDVLMIGRLGAAELAASSLGLVFFYFTFLVGFGPAMAVSPMVSQALGADADNTRDARRSVRMGLWAIAFYFPAMAVFYLFAADIARALGQPEELARLAGPYVLALAPGWPFMLGVILLRNFLAAIDRTRAPLLFVIVTTVINAFLNYLLIYGSWGFPRLELVGAGIASSLAHMIGFFALVAYIQWDKRGRQFDLFSKFLQPDWERLKEVMRLGWPISVTTGFEALLFNASVFIVGRIGVAEVAAYQIALNVAALAFMTPLGFSIAGATRVGLAAGARDNDGVIRAAVVTIGVCVAAIMAFAIPIALNPGFIAGLYLETADPENRTVIQLVATFLPVAAAFMFFDAVQVAANQCLRGLKDVDAPMVLTGISYWIIGFSVAYWLGLHTSLGAIGVWWGLLCSLVTASILLSARLAWVIRRERRLQNS
ncbi:MAG: MATE family efflux transporter [Pseudomonadota bacterium]